MNPHLYTFLISFVLFLLLLDWEKIHINIYGGIIAAVFKLIFNLDASILRLWKYNGVNSHLPDSILFSDNINIFTIGFAFTMGILFLQFLPHNIYLQLTHGLLWALFYVLLKYISAAFNILTYIYLKPYGASHILLFLLSLAWFKTNFLKPNKFLNT